MGRERLRARLGGPAPRLAVAAAFVIIAAGAACGKKAPPFLPVPVTAGRLEITSVIHERHEVRFRVRVPREKYSFEKAEEPWSLARVMRTEEGAQGVFEERSVLREVEGFPFGEDLEIRDGGVDDGMVYVYRIELRKEVSKQWLLSETMTIQPLPAPGLVVGVTIEGREGAVVVTWAPLGEGGELSYLLERRERGEAEGRTLTEGLLTATEYVDTRVEPGREYCYRVRAVMRDKLIERSGPWSGESCGGTVDRIPPPVPERLNIIFEGGGFRLTWFPVEADDLDGYYVYRAHGDESPVRATGTPQRAAEYRDDDVLPGETYHYRVTAVDGSVHANESGFSKAVSGRVPE